MKQISCLLALALLGFVSGAAQTDSYRVVFDLTSRDSLDQKAVVRWVKEIIAAHPQALLEVVMYGKGFELVMPEKSTVIADVREVAKNPNISFTVCAMSLKNNNIERSRVLDEVKTVPDGIYEIIAKQREG
ncbi:MAG TPA: hypothetical protein VNL69_06470, partial [Bacteroidota bacterium]|nr:hypothetical protein [Bacteroidota bacterium]